MSEKNIVQRSFEAFAKEAGFGKHGSSWYRRGHEVVTVLNLQRSQYGAEYYVNLGVWLLGVADVDFPKVHQCHVGTRLEALAESERSEVEMLFDLNGSMDDTLRAEGIARLFDTYLVPALAACADLDSLRSRSASTLLAKSLVMGSVRHLLDAAADDTA